ncbi:LysM peptidoglycan-binding domain-containing protein [Frankia sp. Cj3]|uniref:LysM peptidoglycan-binding domain-containing protein n=1 Tax=Frankia sp. Cj3 TaxID=2880976 RepID=UPI001EF681E5|nr:LysM peptidoglycan-binding domain-containing protein [Frankia sp. Cj3]
MPRFPHRAQPGRPATRTASRPNRSVRRVSRPGRGAVVRGLLALVGLVAFLGVVPVALWLWRTNPLPQTWEPGRWWTLASRGYLHPDVVPNAIAVAAWVLWADVAIAVLREIGARVLRGAAATRSAIVPGFLAHLAGTWVASASVVLVVLATRPIATAGLGSTLSDGPAAVAATVTTAHEQDPGSLDATAVWTATVTDTPASGAAGAAVWGFQEHRCDAYDTLRSLADRYYGDADRWAVIRDASVGARQDDGARLSSGFVAVSAGTILRIPLPHVGPEDRSYPVQPGDSLWTIAEDAYPTANASETARAVDAIFETNRGITDPHGRHLTRPDLINPGMHLSLPMLPGRTTSLTVPVPAAPVQAGPVPETPSAAPTRGIGTPASTEPTITAKPTPARTPATSLGSEPREAPDTATPSSETGDRFLVVPLWITTGGLLVSAFAAQWAARRRKRDRQVRPEHRLPLADPDVADLHAMILQVDDPDGMSRLDAALRALVAPHRDDRPDDAPVPEVLLRHPDGSLEVYLHAPVNVPPAPWLAGSDPRVLTLAVSAPLENVSDIPPPCPALVQLGVTADGAELYVDLEALGALGINDELPDQPNAGISDAGITDGIGLCAVARAVVATIAVSQWAELTTVRTIGFDSFGFAHEERIVTEPDLRTLLTRTIAETRRLAGDLDDAGWPRTLTARVRDPSEVWDPTVVVVTDHAGAPSDVTELANLVESARDGGQGIAVIVPSRSGMPARWHLTVDRRDKTARWRLDPLGITLNPLGLAAHELNDLAVLLADADPEPVAVEAGPADPDAEPFFEGDWQIMVRLLGPVDIISRDGTQPEPGHARSRILEILAWLVTHRNGSRADLETALWPGGGNPRTLTNELSRARRLLEHLVGEKACDWIPTRTAMLKIHPLIVSDLEILQARIAHAQAQRDHADVAIETLRGALDLIRGVPAGYPWLDAELGSALTVAPVTAAVLLARHQLTAGDTPAVLKTTARGLAVLPAHTELFALRLRAHAHAGDTDAVKAEYRAYLRAEAADSFWDGETDRDLEALHLNLIRASSVRPSDSGKSKTHS